MNTLTQHYSSLINSYAQYDPLLAYQFFELVLLANKNNRGNNRDNNSFPRVHVVRICSSE